MQVLFPFLALIHLLIVVSELVPDFQLLPGRLCKEVTVLPPLPLDLDIEWDVVIVRFDRTREEITFHVVEKDQRRSVLGRKIVLPVIDRLLRNRYHEGQIDPSPAFVSLWLSNPTHTPPQQTGGMKNGGWMSGESGEKRGEERKMGGEREKGESWEAVGVWKQEDGIEEGKKKGRLEDWKIGRWEEGQTCCMSHHRDGRR